MFLKVSNKTSLVNSFEITKVAIEVCKTQIYAGVLFFMFFQTAFPVKFLTTDITSVPDKQIKIKIETVLLLVLFCFV